METISIWSRGNQSWKRGLEASIIIVTIIIESFPKHPTRARALIHPLGSFITTDSRERNGKGVSGETVDGVKERDDESGQPETMSYRRQAFAARLSRLVSRFQFRVSSSFPRRLITASFSSLRETSNDQTNFHTLKGRRCLLPEAISPSFPFFLRLNVEDRSP